MKFSFDLDIPDEEIRSAVQDDARNLLAKGAFKQMVFDKISEAVGSEIEVTTKQYMDGVTEETIRQTIKGWMSTDAGRSRLQSAMQFAITGHVSWAMETYVREYLASVPEREILTMVSHMHSRKPEVIERAIYAAMESRASTLLSAKVDEAIAKAGEPLINKVVDNKLPGWIARTVKEMLAAAKYQLLAKTTTGENDV